MPITSRDASQARFSFPRAPEPTRALVRSDGRSYRLEASDKIILFPARRASDEQKLSSIGFWYAHIQSGFSTESVVVILRNLPHHPEEVIRQVEQVADRLAEQLRKSSCLSALYEFDGFQLVSMSC